VSVYKEWILSWAGFFAGGVITGSLAIYVSQYFLLAFFGNIFAWALFIRKMECPNCGAPVYQTTDYFYRRPRLIRLPVEIRKTKCHVCGWDLTKNP
jgi:hypothetical protein